MDKTPQQLAEETRARLQAAMAQQPAAPAPPGVGQPAAEGENPWSLSQRGIDLSETTQQARQMNMEDREAQVADGRGSWGTRAGELISIGDDNTAGPADQIIRPSDIKAAKEYGPKSKHAVGIINRYFGDEDVSELHFNGPDRIFAKHRGRRVQVKAEFSSVEEYNRFVEDLIVRADTTYTLDDIKRVARGVVRMAGGDRMAIMMPPISEYVQLAIHKVVARTWDMDNLVRNQTLTPQMANFLMAAVKSKANILVCGEMGAGKATGIDMPILTPSGWKLMGDIEVGDRVIGRDGKAHSVTGVFPQGELEIFRVTFSDDTWVECCDDHLWQVQTPLRKWRGNDPQVKPLKDIRGNLHDAAGNANWYIPMVEPVHFDPVDLPLDPYVLGALLGDGSLTRRCVEFTTDDEEIVEHIRLGLPAGVQIRRRGDTITYGITKMSGRRNPVTTILSELGVMGHAAHEKFIPETYKFASPNDRLALLQGLMDTDGTCDAGMSSTSFTSTSRQLAEDVVFLVQSLGGTCSLRQRTTSYTHNGERQQGRPSYRVTIALPAGPKPFRLTRKLEKWKEPTKYQPTRAIVDVTPVGRKPAQCISVDAPDRLYVTKDFIVTHNTVMLSLLAKQIGENERVALIEEVPEIFLDKPDVSRFTYYPEVEDGPAMGLAEILDTVLYMRMDRVIVGEIHDKGMYRMLRVMAAGSDGSLSTFHAGTVDEALNQVRNHVILEHQQMPSAIASDFIRGAINVVVIVERVRDTHRVVEIAEVEWRNLQSGSDKIGSNTLFKFNREAVNPAGEKVGRFETVAKPDEKGIIRKKADKHGVVIDDEWFAGANVNFGREGRR